MRVGRNRYTAFLTACSQGNFEIAEVLLEWGAGFSPLGSFLDGPLIRHFFPRGGHAFLGFGLRREGVVSERGARRNGSGHDLSASRASAVCISTLGVFVPITVGSFLCQGVAPSMVGGRNGIMARLVPPTIFFCFSKRSQKCGRSHLSASILHSHDRLSMISVISLRHLCCHAFLLKLGYRSSLLFHMPFTR